MEQVYWVDFKNPFNSPPLFLYSRHSHQHVTVTAPSAFGHLQAPHHQDKAALESLNDCLI